MVTGKPIFGTTCEQILVIEGPGFKSYFPGVGYVEGKWRHSVRNDCLILDENYPVKAFATRDLTYYREGTPIDGVVRNLAFTNIATNTTVNTICDDNETQ